MAPLTAALVLYIWLPVPILGLLSAWLTGIVLVFFPAAALFSLIRVLAARLNRVYVVAGGITLLFALFYSDLVVVESNSIFPALYIGFSLVFLPVLIKGLVARPTAEPDRNTLTRLGISPREEDVVRLLLLGLSYKEIAEKLFISLPTVQTHVTRIYQKAGVNSKMELLRLFNV
jgi:DNA-binding CsgD family transcriptional regulator